MFQCNFHVDMIYPVFQVTDGVNLIPACLSVLCVSIQPVVLGVCAHRSQLFIRTVTEELVRKRAEHNNLEITTLEEVSLHQLDIEK